MQNTPTRTDLADKVAALGPSPQDKGTLEMIVRRPNFNAREVLQTAEIDAETGMVGDNWHTRGSRHTPDGSAHPDAQITLMNSRVIQAIAGTRDRWPLAGDQLFVDLDLRQENLPAGQRIAIGSVILEVTPEPHTGCAKFTKRYGSDATRFINSKEGRAERRRGINAKVVQGGSINVGDTITKVDATD